MDALRATYKTLQNYLLSKIEKPRFDEYGASHNASKVFEYTPVGIKIKKFPLETVEADKSKITTVKYDSISEDRLSYVKRIVDICKSNDMNCIFFTTPLNGQMLEEFTKNEQQRDILKEFKDKISTITPYYDFLYHNEIIDNSSYFRDTMHFTSSTGNLLYARIFNDKSITLPKNFGVLKKLKN